MRSASTMPSADDTCASCGWAPRPDRDDVADRREPGHVGPEQIVDDDVAASSSLERRRSDAPRPSVTGPRPVATSSFSTAQRLGRAAVGRRHLERHAVPPLAVRRVTLVPTCTVMPRFRNAFSSSAETASSSFGTRRGNSSISVTSLPKRRKIDANSTPTAPLPRIAIDFGHHGQMDGLVARDDRLLVDRRCPARCVATTRWRR